MCIIVDANVMGEVFLTPHEDFQPLRLKLTGRKGQLLKLAYGGRLLQEYKKSDDLMEMILELDRNGRARAFADADVEREERVISDYCTSDDSHIVALARVSGVRLLASKDQDLHHDFKNRELLKPRGGRVYQNASHEGLLRRGCECFS